MNDYTLKHLSVALRIKPFMLIGELMQRNAFYSINQSIPAEHAAFLCRKHGDEFLAQFFERQQSIEEDHYWDRAREALNATQTQKQ